MSLYELQRALAMLIRQPEANRGPELRAFIAGFDLEPGEARQIEGLAGDFRVAKYGRAMAGVRWEITTNKIDLLKRYVPEELLEELWWEVFDPDAADVRASELALAFVRCLAESPRARARLAEVGPPFIADLVAFKAAELEVYRRMRERPSPPEGSRLAHRVFACVQLEHDILDCLGALASARPGEAPPAPSRRTVAALLAWRPGTPSSRLFEIDRPTLDFLEAQDRGDTGAALATGEYGPLVEIGLLRAERGGEIASGVRGDARAEPIARPEA